MSSQSQLPSVLRFGIFEIDVRAGELRRSGVKLKLQEQPFQVLCMLLEHPGEVVTREELRNRLWPADTFVDFDHGVNAAIKRLRDALADSADNPRFVETLVRRGYRFIPSVEEVGPPQGTAPKALAVDPSTRPRLAPFHRKSTGWLAVLASVGLIVVALVTYLARHQPYARPVTKPIDSVAVLPFASEAATADMEYLIDGITQDAIDHLSKLPKVKVISMSSVLPYRGRQVSPKQVGQDLGVRAVMIGKIVFRGDAMDVMAELIDTSDGTHIWGKQYHRKISDIMSVQEDIAREIAANLETRLSRQQEDLLRKRYTEDFEAWQLYLRGRYYWNKRTEENLERGIAYFQQAVDRDPTNALAYAGLADSYFVQSIAGALPTREAMPKAKAAALKALELDDSLAEAHTSLAQITANYEWNWPEAEVEYTKAIELNSNYSTAHHYYSTFLMAMGRHAEALEEMKRAQELDPLSPIIATFIGKAYYFAGKNEESIAKFKKVLASDPNFGVARGFLIQSLEQSEQLNEALAEMDAEAAQTRSTAGSLAFLRRAYQTAGPRGYWRERLSQMRRKFDQQPGEILKGAAVCARLGDKEQAFSLLGRAFDQHDMWLMYLNVDPSWDNLRSDPRFQSLLHRIGLV